MSGSQTDLPLTIERPRCLHCRARTTLAGIGPGRLGYELRTFKCPDCKRVQRSWMISDPMRGDVRGWFDGELKSPN